MRAVPRKLFVCKHMCLYKLHSFSLFWCRKLTLEACPSVLLDTPCIGPPVVRNTSHILQIIFQTYFHPLLFSFQNEIQCICVLRCVKYKTLFSSCLAIPVPLTSTNNPLLYYPFLLHLKKIRTTKQFQPHIKADRLKQ